VILYDAPDCWDRRRILADLAQTYAGETGGTPFRELPSYVGGVCIVDGACSAASPGLVA
jgi:hypothetical protein